MMKGVILVGWDDKIGPKVELCYPENHTLDEKKIIEYLITIQSLSSSNTIFVQDDNQSTLIFGIPTTSMNYNYNYLVMVLDEKEEGKVDLYKSKLKVHGSNILWAKDFNKKKEFFKQFIEDISNPPVYKIVFIGFPNAGKTSVKKFFFDNIKSETILNKTIVPTEGFETNIYDIIDVRISHYDTSGQELDSWFSEESNIFLESEFVVFFFSVEDWMNKNESVKIYLKKFQNILYKENSIKKSLIFCHKIDLLDNKNRDRILDEIKKYVDSLGLDIRFTTLIEGGNMELISGFQDLFVNYSKTINQILQIFSMLFSKYKISPILIKKQDSIKDIIINYDLLNKFNSISVFSNILSKSPIKANENKNGSFFLFNSSPNNIDNSQLNDSDKNIDGMQQNILCFNIFPINSELSYLICLRNLDKKDFNIRIDEIIKYYNEIIDKYKILEIKK